MPGLEGRTLDRYELRRVIGKGGMADVYEGYDPHFDRLVAVKVFKREDEEMLKRFIREAHLMARLRHEHLVPIYDTGQSDINGLTCYYIVMPLMEGGTLRARVRRSPLSLPDACRCLQSIGSALDYIHHLGIIHRDIKASNVLFDSEGTCYLTDFGIARNESDVSQLTSTGSVLGTVDYVAPELFEVDHKADAGSDLYSLGVLLFEMVTGKLPFSAENQLAVVSMHMKTPAPSPSSMAPQAQIPLAVDNVVLRTLEKNPEQRYSSATELANAFCHAITARLDANDIQERSKFTQQKPPAVAILPAGPQQIVLPPIPLVGNTPQAVRPMPLSQDTETSPYFPNNWSPSQSRPAPPPVNARPHENQSAPISSTPPTRRSNGRRSSNERTARQRLVIVALIALITLLLVIIPSVYVLNMHSNNPPTTGNQSGQTPGGTTIGATSTQRPTATPNLTATAQAHIAATATAQAKATAAAIASATAVAQAHASATAGVIQTATTGQTVYQDSLNNSSNPSTQGAQWDGLNGGDSHCTFASDGYHDTETVGPIGLHGCKESGYTYKNVAISINTTMLSGHSGGLFFRLSTDLFNNYSGYLFEVDSAGHYKISRVDTSVFTTLQDWTSTTALKQNYHVTNTLQIIMQGSTYLFYANGVFLTQITDGTYTSAGEIGVLATTTNTNADIVYSALSVYPKA